MMTEPRQRRPWWFGRGGGRKVGGWSADRSVRDLVGSG
jgi:hypothetical protein